ncbi:MAG: succinate dehydrogenase, cytochrome b556 subunit [Proteobacteria bacterium]|nr:succinate dehydrogenase, cytochrome b556 subunit [Pseudomonadota bacterium]
MADNPQVQTRHPRPLSPFLTVYRWPVTMATSITHRVTGVGISAGLILIAWWLVALTREPEQYDLFVWVVSGPLGQIVLFGFVWALAFHLLNGIRHLMWDMGYGFKVPTANKTGVLVVTLSVLLAIGVFVFAHMEAGVGAPL